MSFHLSWKQKFRLLILLVLLGLSLMAGSSYRANQRLFEAFEARQAAAAFQQASLALLADWRRLDTFRVLNGQSADELERAMASVGEAAGQLAEQGAGLDDAALQDATQRLVEAVRQNLDLRRQWLQVYRELGLDPTQGERHGLDVAAARLKEIPFGAIQPYIATATASQANYMATFEAAYAQQARGALDALQKAIADLGWQDNVVGQAAAAFAAAFAKTDTLIHTLAEQQDRLARQAVDIQARVERQAATLRDGILRASAEQAVTARRSALAWLAGGFAVVAAVLLATLGRASHSLMVHLDRVIRLLCAVALGDLTQRLSPGRNRRDEFARLGAASNDMTDGIAGVIRQVIDGNRELSRVHAYLADAMRQLDRSSGQVEAQTAQAASASQQISATVNEMAQRASQVGDATHAALAAARGGATTIVGNADNTRRLSRLIQATHQQIGVLGRSAGRVNGIVDVINGLAGQTNLLALNAAIEAARAGEAGRGFSVVADEVRSLAQKTVAATTDIAQIVEDLRDQTQKMDTLMADGLALAEESERDAGAVAGAIEAITASMERLGTDMAQIAVSIEEISVTTEDVAAKIEDINQQTAQTRELRETLDGHAHHLTAQVEALAASASRFRLA